MTQSDTSKAINALKALTKASLMGNGFIGLRGDRVSMPHDHFAHVVEVSRVKQRNELGLLFGVAIYNTDCQHLHFTLNGIGTCFMICPAFVDEAAKDIDRHIRNVVIPALSRFGRLDTLLGSDSPISETAKQSLAKEAGQHYVKNKKYWNGDMTCSAIDQQW